MAAIAVVQWQTNQTFSPALYLRLAIGLVFVACFMAWRTEHRKFQALEGRLAAPDMAGSIGSINVIAIGRDTVVIVGGLIVNPFGPPSVVTNWDVTLEFPDSLPRLPSRS
jgi:hypothetical protein